MPGRTVARSSANRKNMTSGWCSGCGIFSFQRLHSPINDSDQAANILHEGSNFREAASCLPETHHHSIPITITIIPIVMAIVKYGEVNDAEAQVDTHDGDGEEKATARLGSTLVTPYSGLLLRRSVSRTLALKSHRASSAVRSILASSETQRGLAKVSASDNPRNLHHLFTSLHEEQNEELGL